MSVDLFIEYIIPFPDPFPDKAFYSSSLQAFRIGSCLLLIKVYWLSICEDKCIKGLDWMMSMANSLNRTMDFEFMSVNCIK
jgi:hypothetical protein